MIDNVKNIIFDNSLFSKNDKLILAISGGADSVCLMHILLSLGYKLELAHCNFNLRGIESNEDEEFVKKLSNVYKLKLHIQSFDTEKYSIQKSLSTQMAARELRYKWFKKLKIKQKAKYIILAHHNDDDIETYFINLLRGTGIKGLLGIPIKKDCFIRPLINFSRLDIERYISINNLEYRDDSSNSSLKYLRNKIRSKLLPLLYEINPNLKQTLLNEKKILKETFSIYHQQIEFLRKKIVSCRNEVIEIDKKELLKLTPINHYLFEFLSPYGFSDFDKINKALRNQPGKQFFSETHQLLIDRNFLFIKQKKISFDKEILIPVEKKEITSPINLSFSTTKKNKYNTNSNYAYIDFDKLEFPLTLRKWEEGDKFIPLGMENFQKLSDFFIDNKFSLYDKSDQWLLCSREDIIWIVGQRIDDRYKLQSKTKKVYIAKYLK